MEKSGDAGDDEWADVTNAVPVDLKMVLTTRWIYRHVGSWASAADLICLSNGILTGYDHPNERFWQLDQGRLTFLSGQRVKTVTFDRVFRQGRRFKLQGVYQVAPELGLVLELEDNDQGRLLPGNPARPLSYEFNDGGITNQKLALLGLFRAAKETGSPLAMPAITIMDQVKNSRDPVEFSKAFDAVSIQRFADKYGVEIVADQSSRVGQRGWQFFVLGSTSKADLNKSETSTWDAFVRDFFQHLQPRLQKSFLLMQLRKEISGTRRITTVLQMRIEKDWVEYSGRALKPIYGDSEDYNATYREIISKVAQTLPETTSILALADEAALPVSKQEIQFSCQQEFGIELLFKSDFLSEFELDLLTPLDLSLVDFELAMLGQNFIGNSRSTFSNMVAFESHCRSLSCNQWIYNARGPGLALRSDNGRFDDPERACSP